MTLPDGTSWLEHFTTVIQLITAINVTYIFTHFPKKIYDSIYNYEVTRREKYALFKDTHLLVLEDDLDNMRKKKVLGQALTVPEKLMSEVKRVGEQWEAWAKWSDKLIDRSKEVKGVKCLFLYVSVYCFVCLLGIGIVNVWSECGTVCDVLSIYNVVSTVFSIFILVKVLSGSWNIKEDNECYDVTRRYIGWTMVLTVILCVVNGIFVQSGAYVVIPGWLQFAYLAICVVLPFLPCLFSIMYVMIVVSIIDASRYVQKIVLRVKLRDIKRKKKKIEDACRLIDDDSLDWR